MPAKTRTTMEAATLPFPKRSRPFFESVEVVTIDDDCVLLLTFLFGGGGGGGEGGGSEVDRGNRGGGLMFPMMALGWERGGGLMEEEGGGATRDGRTARSCGRNLDSQLVPVKPKLQTHDPSKQTPPPCADEQGLMEEEDEGQERALQYDLVSLGHNALAGEEMLPPDALARSTVIGAEL